jgi:hypothetical protein
MSETIDVYYQGKHIDAKTFHEFFVIARHGDNVVWFTEGEKPCGGAQVYISAGGGWTTIKSMQSSWKLIIDNIEAEKKGYSSLLVRGRTVEFVNTDYRFVGRFSGQPRGTVADVLSREVIGQLMKEHEQKAKETEKE